MTTTSQDQDLFPGSAYDLPIPKLDGHKADKLVIALGGTIELDRTSSEDLDLIAALDLGTDIELAIVAAVAGKGFALKASEGDETTTYRISLRAHTLRQ